MEDRRLTHLRMMLGRLAHSEEPYGDGPFDSHHIEIDQGGAQLLIEALDGRDRLSDMLRNSARHTVFWRGMWRHSQKMRAKDQAELKADRATGDGALPCGCDGPSATCADRAAVHPAEIRLASIEMHIHDPVTGASESITWSPDEIDMGEKPPDPM